MADVKDINQLLNQIQQKTAARSLKRERKKSAPNRKVYKGNYKSRLIDMNSLPQVGSGEKEDPSSKPQAKLRGKKGTSTKGGSASGGKDEREEKPPVQDKPAQLSNFSNKTGNLLEKSGLNVNYEDPLIKETYDRFKNALTSKNKTTVLKEAASLGLALRSAIAGGSFKGFIIALIIGITKDISDFPDFGFLLGPTLNLFVVVVLIVILWGQGTFLKRWLLKKFYLRFIFAMIIEFIPIANFFPSYTIGIIMIKRSANKRRKALESSLSNLEINQKKIK